MGKKTKINESGLTAAEVRMKTADLAMKHGSKYAKKQAQHSYLVNDRLAELIDKEREALWVPERVVESMPQWVPTVVPAVQEVLGASVKEVRGFMETISRKDKGVLVGKLTDKVCKKVKRDRALVEEVVWGALFRLQKDQGVVVLREIEKAVG